MVGSGMSGGIKQRFRNRHGDCRQVPVGWDLRRMSYSRFVSSPERLILGAYGAAVCHTAELAKMPFLAAVP